MALSPTDPYPSDPSIPRKITPPPDPLQTPSLQQPTPAPTTAKPPSAPNVNTIPSPGGASAIGQLPDGAGGAVTVPPPSMAPQSYDQAIASQPVGGAGYTPMGQMSGPTDQLGRPIGPSGKYEPFSGPTFTNGPDGQVSTFQQPDGSWTNANGSALAAGTDQWGRSTMTGTGMQPSSTAGVANPSAGQPSVPNGPNVNAIPSNAGTLPGTPGAMPSTFSADQNLINSQINPAASARLLGVQGMSDQALQQVLNGPDRAALGKQYYDTFAQRAQNQFGHALTDATNQAAAHGQIGSGMLTNRYGDLTQQFNLDNTTAANDFATRALEGTIGDRLNNLGAARGAENSIYGQEAAGRNELRGERGYQQSLAEQAIAQRIAQNQMEQGQQQQNFGDAATLYGLGNANDPTSAYQNAAGLSSAEAAAANGDVGALLRYYAQRQNPVPAGSY